MQLKEKIFLYLKIISFSRRRASVILFCFWNPHLLNNMRYLLFSEILLSFDDYKMVLFVVITKSEKENGGYFSIMYREIPKSCTDNL